MGREEGEIDVRTMCCARCERRACARIKRRRTAVGAVGTWVGYDVGAVGSAVGYAVGKPVGAVGARVGYAVGNCKKEEEEEKEEERCEDAVRVRDDVRE